jgi:hypothetical protein
VCRLSQEKSELETDSGKLAKSFGCRENIFKVESLDKFLYINSYRNLQKTDHKFLYSFETKGI